MAMSIVSIEDVKFESSLDENEKTNLEKLDLIDKIVLGGGSENQKQLFKLNKQKEYQDLSSCLSNELPKFFQRVYDVKTVNLMEEYGMHLLRYFKVLKEKETSLDKYKSFHKIIDSALEYKKAINSLKIEHGNLTSKLGMIKTRLTIRYPICFRKIVDLNNFEDKIGNNSEFDSILSMLNLNDKLDECKAIFDKIDLITNNFNSIYDYNQTERENLSIIIASKNVKEMLDSYDQEIRNLRELIKSTRESLEEVKKEKFEYDSEKTLSTVKVAQLNEILELKKKQLDDLNGEIKRLKENKESNMNIKKNILETFYDPKKINEYISKQQQICQQFDDQYAQSLLQINKESSELFDDIKNVKVVQKNYSIIFILDESGSMAPHFKTVITSVKKVIDKRKKEPIAKDRVSVIKFNSKALIEHINVDIKEDITITDLRGGGTSFIEPLKKLRDVLSQIDKDLFIPIVFFLSDGYGERCSDVLKFCKKVYQEFSTIDMLFFTVGYGNAPGKKINIQDNLKKIYSYLMHIIFIDIETLEEMAKVFNNDKLILNIGGEMCKLYNNVQNEKDLMNAFTLFEKLFKYQKNLIETKKTLFQTYMLDREQINKNSTDALNRMRQTNEELENKRQAFVDGKTTNLDEINKKFNATIDEINGKIKKLNEEIDETLDKKKKFEDSLIKINLSSTTVDPVYSKKIEALKDLENKLAEISKKERESILKQVTNMDENREANFSKCLEDLGKEGITIQEKDIKDFKIAFYNFSKNFHEYKLFRDDIQKRSNDIKVHFEQVLEQMSEFNSTIQNFRVISNSQNLKNKIWELIVYNYNLQNSNDQNSNLTDIEYLKRILLIKLDLRDDDNDQDVKDMNKALNLINKNIGVNDLVSKLEGNSLKIETFVENIVDDIKQRIKDTKKDLKELQKNDDVIAEKIQKLEVQIDNFENQIDDYKDNKRVINCILEALNGVRMTVREKYLRKRVFDDLRNMIQLIINVYIPHINAMSIEYTKNSN
jgi:hypothetical protein